MPRAIIHYFSGTGNSYRVAVIVKDRLEKAGYNVGLKRIDKAGPPEPSDLDVFTFPVYAYDVPDIMLKYMRGLPGADKRKAAVIAVHGMLWQKPVIPGDGGDPGYSFEHARLLLRRKGYDVFFTAAVGYPHSISMLLSAPVPKEQAKIRDASDERVEEFGKKIAAGERSLQKCGLLPLAYSAVPGIMFGIFGRRGLGKLLIADTGCIKCGKCVDSCPSGTIKLRMGRPRWGWKCQGCQRCINVCPQRSIQLSLPRLAILFGGLFLPLGAWLYVLWPLSLFLPHESITGVLLDLAVWLVLYSVMIYVLDKAFFILEATPILGKIMSLNLSSPNRRYLDPNFKPLILAEAEIPVKR
jgi:ferredoxin